MDTTILKKMNNTPFSPTSLKLIRLLYHWRIGQHQRLYP